MRTRAVLIAAAVVTATHTVAAGPPVRKPLDPSQRNAVLALLRAVDRVQDADVASNDDPIEWDGHVLKASNRTAYVPFRVNLKTIDTMKSAALYVRAVSRHDGFRSKEEKSALREWVEHGGGAPPVLNQTVQVAPGELPVGGPSASSSRQSTQAAAEASALLTLQRRQYEKEKAAAEAEARKKSEETPERRRDLFPFEEYYFADVKGHAIERALALPSGEYDLFVAIVDKSKVATSTPVVIRRTVTVPDYWNDELSLSPVIIVKEFRQLKGPLSEKEQPEHPYTFGAADIQPATATTFADSEVLTLVYQICNYGAPDVDVTTEFRFYQQINGERTLFNRTEPQTLSDADLPPPKNWTTQGFVMQTLPLAPFPSGRYELEILARDRLTRRTATTTMQFTVK